MKKPVCIDVMRDYLRQEACNSEEGPDLAESLSKITLMPDQEINDLYNALTMKLTIELVPQTCWFSNVRSSVSSKDWDKLKLLTSKAAGNKCEICGGVGRQWPVECHEIWEYDDAKKIQRLRGLIALCPNCHEVKHIGYAKVRGRAEMATKHLCKVNNLTAVQGTNYVRASFLQWRDRSQHKWTLDISFLDQYGITVKGSK